jgi:hypothetical protein
MAACEHLDQIELIDAPADKHATAHFASSGHPIVRSVEPGEDWSWCYADEVAFRVTR